MKGLGVTVQELSMYGVPVLTIPVVGSYLHTHKHTLTELAPEIIYCWGGNIDGPINNMTAIWVPHAQADK